jgi:hypothetical protein
MHSCPSTGICDAPQFRHGAPTSALGRSGQAFVAEHLAELVAALEADGGAAAQRINTAAAEMHAGYAEWALVEQRVPRLLPWLNERRADVVCFAGDQAR